MKILVVGDVILDKYIEGKVTRISPEAPVPIINVTNERSVLGGSANVAHNLANLGINTYILGVIGNDTNGKIVQELLENHNINSSLVISNSFPTISKIRIIGEKQQIARIDYEDIQKKLSVKEFNLSSHLATTKYDLIVLSDYNKNVCTEEICLEISTYALKNGIKVLVDPKGDNWTKYYGSYIVTPNIKELQEVSKTNFANTDDEIEKIGVIVKKIYGITNLIITRSEKGITLIDKNNTTQHFHTVAKEVFDVSGAGDTVIAVLAKYIAEGFNIVDAIKYANLAAGFVISKMGTYAIKKEDLNELKTLSDN